jgi:1-acyl-sn-glycerol-3-phosphate acyltransferase
MKKKERYGVFKKPFQYLVEKQKARDWDIDYMDQKFIQKQLRLWNYIAKYYFRLDVTGLENVPKDQNVIFAGGHSGTWLTMDAWTFVYSHGKKFCKEGRHLHFVAHEVLFGFPLLGSYFRKLGGLPPIKSALDEALNQGKDLVIWPGGEIDSMRSWKRRHEVEFGGRKGFIKLAIKHNVPIVPVATVGGSDTVIVLTENQWLARLLGVHSFPLSLGIPFGIWFEMIPSHIPMPAKIRTKVLAPVAVDPGRIDDKKYIDEVYNYLLDILQKETLLLSKKRKFPVFE